MFITEERNAGKYETIKRQVGCIFKITQGVSVLALSFGCHRHGGGSCRINPDSREWSSLSHALQRRIEQDTCM